MSNIQEALLSLFEKHRIVFWYDEKCEMQTEFADLQLEGVKRLEINNNEYGLKYKILREEPKQKFLLYHEGRQPKDMENWLLDVQLAHTVFSADQVSLWMAELELGPEYAALVREHQDFFAASSRREALRARDIKHNIHEMLKLKMIAVCLGPTVEPTVENIVLALLEELAQDKTDAFESLNKFQLLEPLYEELKNRYG
ncbi:MAG: BREX-1 system phosphatase PglZ type A, partial [Anaerolineaceae bacterium]|nr:BREX-1 system phosphatase PglZ type A [Anaerolineaceae bacterium]